MRRQFVSGVDQMEGIRSCIDMEIMHEAIQLRQDHDVV
ncbi:hypothetical protein SAMN05216275_14460, partial [Streptosporangium canum]